MDNVTELREFRLSIAQIAAEFGMARATVSKRIDALGIKPGGMRLGYPVFRLRDVVRITGDAEPGDENNPEKMRPTDRRAHWQSENERLKFLVSSGDLLKVEDVREVMARLVKILVRGLSTLADRLERDKRVKPEIVEYIETVVGQLRNEIANEMDREFSEQEVKP